MIPLRVRTEYSFRAAYGRIEAVVAALAAQECTAAAITDDGTWGHAHFARACAKANITPIFGVEIAVVSNAQERAKQAGARCVFLARTQDGLAAIYRLLGEANAQFYYHPRVDYRQVLALPPDDVYVIATAGVRLDRLPPAANLYLAYDPTTPAWNARIAELPQYEKVLLPNNRYPTRADRKAYEVHAGDERVTATVPLHIASEAELRAMIPQVDDDAVLNTERIAADIVAQGVVVPQVGVVRYEGADAVVRDRCVLSERYRANVVYVERMNRELDVIREKGFADYFILVGDMIAEAKQTMFVGPGRGSAAGSLVCYLLGITDVDPIQHGLLFERFIDITRSDWPDIDVDFPDATRDLVFTQLAATHGADRVGRIGNIIKYGPKMALDDAARALRIPQWELRTLKDAVEDRWEGDAEWDKALRDAFATLEEAKRMQALHPGIEYAALLEGHCRTSGTHAGGVVVADRPLDTACGIGRSADGADGVRVLQVDKREAERQGMLKIDVLGLRTLSVLDTCLTLIGKTRQWLLDYPLDDDRAFDILRQQRFAGVFQFEGRTQGNLARGMSVTSFDQIVALGALSRPGPLIGGATAAYIKRTIGAEPVESIHPLVDAHTRETQGVIVYQEQVMAVLRHVGGFDWPTVTTLRRAMGKSLGQEYFNKYRDGFVAGATAQGVPEKTARLVWDMLVTFGAYGFNKSHSVAYGLISYWCCVLKAQHPLEFACANLRHAKSDEQSVEMLRDLVREGYRYLPVDPTRSGLEWTVADGTLLGGLTTVRGIGPAHANIVLRCREVGKALPDGIARKLDAPQTPFDDIFEGERRWADIYKHPAKYKITSQRPVHINAIDDVGTYIFVAKIVERELKQKKDVKPGDLFPESLLLEMADDTGSIKVRINGRNLAQWGRPFIDLPEADVVGRWFIVKGSISNMEWRDVWAEAIRWLEPPESARKAKVEPAEADLMPRAIGTIQP